MRGVPASPSPEHRLIGQQKNSSPATLAGPATVAGTLPAHGQSVRGRDHLLSPITRLLPMSAGHHAKVTTNGSRTVPKTKLWGSARWFSMKAQLSQPNDLSTAGMPGTLQSVL